MSDETGMEVTTQPQAAVSEYAFTDEDSAEMLADIAAMSGGEKSAIGLNILQRVSIPSGTGVANTKGPLTWRLPTGETDVLRGVVLHRSVNRRWHSKPYTGGGELPDCVSINLSGRGSARAEIINVFGQQGVGGECDSCAMTEFGTQINQDGSKGAGRGCPRRTELYILPPKMPLPLHLDFSERNFEAFFEVFVYARAAGHRKPWSFELEIRLERAVNKDGLAYAIAVPSIGRALSQAEAVGAEQLANHWGPIIDAANEGLRAATLRDRSGNSNVEAVLAEAERVAESLGR